MTDHNFEIFFTIFRLSSFFSRYFHDHSHSHHFCTCCLTSLILTHCSDHLSRICLFIYARFVFSYSPWNTQFNFFSVCQEQNAKWQKSRATCGSFPRTGLPFECGALISLVGYFFYHFSNRKSLERSNFVISWFWIQNLLFVMLYFYDLFKITGF